MGRIEKGFDKQNEVKKKPLLSIGLMVSDRMDTLRRCLDSLAPIRQAIDCQLVITNNGHNEDVAKIIEEYADVTGTFDWCSDFARARNANLELATGQWYLYLDDDEWFTEVDEIIDFFKSGNYKNYDCACYIQRNFHDHQGQHYNDTWVSRMIRLDEGVHFVSKIHEYLVPVMPKMIALNSVVDHYGYIFDDEAALMKHYDRNSLLLLDMIKEEPEVLRWRIHLAKEYMAVRKYADLDQLGIDGLALIEKKTDLDSQVMRGCFYMARIIAACNNGDTEKALILCDQTMEDERITELTKACVAWWRMHMYFLGKDYARAKKAAEEYFEWERFFDMEKGMYLLQQGAAFVAQTYETSKKEEAEYVRDFADILQMKDNILKQVDVMVQKGNFRDAGTFVDQLITLLPGDEELIEKKEELENLDNCI